MTQKLPRGFTLVELLVTVALMALVAGTCLAVLGGGMRVWRRATAYGTQEQSVLVAFDRMRRDLENARRFSPVPFEGRYDQPTFAQVERVDSDSQNPYELGQLGYFLNERQHLLCRSFVPYRSMKRVKLKDHCQPILEGVAAARFSYFGTTEEGEAGWSQRWHSKELPSAVRVSLTIGEDAQSTGGYSFIVALMNARPHATAQP